MEEYNVNENNQENYSNVEESVNQEGNNVESTIEELDEKVQGSEYVQNDSKKSGDLNHDVLADNIPKEYKPISMWGYFGYEILFAIPVIGFLAIIIFALGGSKNINLKNYARSKFCILIVLLVLLGIVFIVAGVHEAIRVLPNFKFNF